MLAIRMQRTGRKGHAEFRVIVQEAALSPTSGRVVARVGHHNPHTKETVLDTEKVDFYLKNGAQPSERVVRLLKTEKIKLPNWVTDIDTKKEGKIRNPHKLRRNRPDEPAEPVAPAEEKPTDESSEQKAEEPTQAETEKVEENGAKPEDTADASTDEEKPAAEEPATKASDEKPKEEASEAKAEKVEESEEAQAEDKSEAETTSEEKPDEDAAKSA